MLAIGYDHQPILLNFNPHWKNGKIPFKNFGPWLDHADCRKIIAECWNKVTPGSSAFSIARKLKDIKLQIRVQNKEFYGNIKTNIEECKQHLTWLHTYYFRADRGQALADARKQLKNWHDIEEKFWKTKSRDQLIKLGDQNTSYFHRATKIRARRNKIETIQTKEGIWITEHQEVKDCFTNHFSHMATAEITNSSSEIINLIPSTIAVEDNITLNRKPEPEEIKAILFSMANDKAPGPDGFPPNFFKINWDIIAALINGSPDTFFKPSSGLRQGDPLSPYLFLFCMESLLRNLLHTEEIGLIHGMKICKAAPSISHLLFADDCMIFYKANTIEAQNIMQLLQTFGSTSGQLINFHKSGIFFSKNTNPELIPQISHSMGVQVLQLDDKYLRSPLFTHRSKINSFKPGVEKFKLRLTGWKHTSLNPANREVIIKSVTSSARIHQMNCFKVPKKTCKDINNLQRDFFWGKNIENPSGYYPKAWTTSASQNL
ncbi:uncharacterized protein LOC113272774 [Papaver somniferum]|uniref:uncharacterized protein LOC113272774 n=1 Tax=Papaver somniferum TaxID=3469 RepID=UPI000E6F75BA|nr:uncharacterized protein LOC113272774 [Papaver somniferum]